jgi:RNA-directed DNA polymerase
VCAKNRLNVRGVPDPRLVCSQRITGLLKVLPRTLRVHSLTGRITRDALYKAFKAVKRNRGAAGLDKQSIKMFEANLEEHLLALMRELQSGTYQPTPLRRVYIPKGKGVLRPLGIPTVRCRVAQEVIRALMEPIFEPTFHDSSHGFRRHRSCHTAMAQLVELHQQGYRVVVDADLKGFFDSIPHQLILDLVAREIADGNILCLIKKWLQAGVMEEGEVRPTRQGTPQGGVCSPLLANIVGRLFGRKGTVSSMTP